VPREIDGERYYETTEVCEKVGISRPTLFRWLRRGILSKLHKDRRGWRLFTEEDLNKIQAEAKKIEVEYTSVAQIRNCMPRSRE
jgi:DNA-binding transcriptional MerR regulator